MRSINHGCCCCSSSAAAAAVTTTAAAAMTVAKVVDHIVDDIIISMMMMTRIENDNGPGVANRLDVESPSRTVHKLLQDEPREEVTFRVKGPKC